MRVTDIRPPPRGRRSTVSSLSMLSRQAVVLGALGWRHLRNEPVAAAVLALRLVPTGLKRATGRVVLAATPHHLVTVRSLALWDGGDREAAVGEITKAAPAASPALLRRLTRLSLAFGRSGLARDLMRRLPADDRARPSLEALVAWREGRLGTASELLDAVVADQPVALRSSRSRRMRRLVQGELAALDPDRRTTWATDEPGSVPVRGRVLHLVTNSLPYTNAGYTIRTHMLARAQRRAGLDPHVVTKLGFPVVQGVLTTRTRDVIDGVPYYRLLPGRLPAQADQQLDLNTRLAARLVDELRPAVLHAATNYLNGQVALALRGRYALPFIYEVRGFLEESWVSRHDGEDARASDRFMLARRLETHCMSEADAVVTLSERMKAEIASRGIPAERIYVLPNAVDESLLEPIPDAGGVRHALGATDGEIVLGIVSTFYPHEGIDVLVKATALLRDRGANVRLALVGDGTERQALEHLVRELGIGDITTMTGRVPFEQVRSYYAALDVFVAPRTDDRVSHMVTPLKPIEAMAAGRAVVASAVGGLMELVEDGVTGVLVPPGDPTALADALEPLLYDEALRCRLGKAARERVASELTWSRNAERYRSLYASLGAA